MYSHRQEPVQGAALLLLDELDELLELLELELELLELLELLGQQQPIAAVCVSTIVLRSRTFKPQPGSQYSSRIAFVTVRVAVQPAIDNATSTTSVNGDG